MDLGTATVSTIAGNGTAGRPMDGAAAVDTPLAGPRAACMTTDGTIYLAPDGRLVIADSDNDRILAGTIEE